MNTKTTRTDPDNTGTSTAKGIKRAERRKDYVYKGDRVDVWSTGVSLTPGVGNTKAGVKKSMHPILAEKLVGKGVYSYEKVAQDKEKKSKGKFPKEIDFVSPEIKIK